MQLTIAALRRRFSYHQPNTDEKIARHQRVRDACFEAADEIRQVTEPSREQSTAITKIEEAMFWANAAIARPKEDA
jgi:hypothetical protein